MPSERTGPVAARPIHDAHCHFLSARFYEALGREKYGADARMPPERIAGDLGWEPAGSPDALAARWIAELDRHHVERAALIASVPGDEDSVAAAVARHPARFVGFFALNAGAPDACDRARRAFGELGLRCMCLFSAMHRYRLDDEKVARVFEVAAAHRHNLAGAHACEQLQLDHRGNLRRDVGQDSVHEGLGHGLDRF